MNRIQASFRLEKPIDTKGILASLERAARTCYQSFENISKDSAIKLIKQVISLGHESVVEHEKITVRIILSRAVMAELTRHRMASFSVESTRYCRYQNIEFIQPWWWNDIESVDFARHAKKREIWLNCMSMAEHAYQDMLSCGMAPQGARDCLPLATKTELVITANLREWRHIFKLRCSPRAHPDMRAIMMPIFEKFNEALPEVFGDMKEDIEADPAINRSCWAVEKEIC